MSSRTGTNAQGYVQKGGVGTVTENPPPNPVKGSKGWGTQPSLKRFGKLVYPHAVWGDVKLNQLGFWPNLERCFEREVKKAKGQGFKEAQLLEGLRWLAHMIEFQPETIKMAIDDLKEEDRILLRKKLHKLLEEDV